MVVEARVCRSNYGNSYSHSFFQIFPSASSLSMEYIHSSRINALCHVNPLTRYHSSDPSLPSLEVKIPALFIRCVLASLYEAVSVRRSVRRSVRWSVRHTRVEFPRNGLNSNKIASGIRRYAIWKTIQRQVRGQLARTHL